MSSCIRRAASREPTLVVALGYPLYFILGGVSATDNLGGLWCELALMLPAAGWFASATAARAALPTNAEGFVLAHSLLERHQRAWRWCIYPSPAVCCLPACSGLLELCGTGAAEVVALLARREIGQGKWPNLSGDLAGYAAALAAEGAQPCCAAPTSPDSGGRDVAPPSIMMP